MPKLKLRSEEKFDSGMLSPTVCFCSDSGGGSAPAPDYTPMAQASEESARIMAAQADRVLDESKRQYDLNTAVAKPVIDAQLGIMNETARQGKDYYDYMVAKQRPVEDALNADAMAAGTDAKAEAAAGRAIADSQGGYTRALNQGFRQARRYGLNPVNQASSLGLAQAQATAAAANGAREKEKNLGYAKKLDVAGLYRGMPGASTAAYGVATNAGNSAVGNQMQPSNQLMNANVSSAGIVGQGQGLRLQGLGNILNSQTSMYNASMANQGGDSGFMGALGTLGGAAITKWSDRRLKTLIESVGVDEDTGLTLYDFNYIDDPDRRYRGVMADEVERFMPEAVEYENGYAKVNYSMLGIEMQEI